MVYRNQREREQAEGLDDGKQAAGVVPLSEFLPWEKRPIDDSVRHSFEEVVAENDADVRQDEPVRGGRPGCRGQEVPGIDEEENPREEAVEEMHVYVALQLVFVAEDNGLFPAFLVEDALDSQPEYAHGFGGYEGEEEEADEQRGGDERVGAQRGGYRVAGDSGEAYFQFRVQPFVSGEESVPVGGGGFLSGEVGFQSRQSECVGTGGGRKRYFRLAVQLHHGVLLPGRGVVGQKPYRLLGSGGFVVCGGGIGKRHTERVERVVGYPLVILAETSFSGSSIKSRRASSGVSANEMIRLLSRWTKFSSMHFSHHDFSGS